MSTYQQEVGPPDQICLSYTHDRDYVERVKNIHLRSWWPPSSEEYEGCDEVIAESFGFDSAMDDV